MKLADVLPYFDDAKEEQREITEFEGLILPPEDADAAVAAAFADVAAATGYTSDADLPRLRSARSVDPTYISDSAISSVRRRRR